MRKLMLAVLVGVFCLGTTNTFAQTKQETPQEKILRLEVENRVLSERVTALTQEVVSLQSKLAAAQAQQTQSQQTQGYQAQSYQAQGQRTWGSMNNFGLKPAWKAAAQTNEDNTSSLKPYYANMDIQQKCEKYPKCAEWVAKQYAKETKRDRIFKVTNVKEEQYYHHQTWLTNEYTVYGLYLYTNLTSTPVIYYRMGRGQKPLSWNDWIELPSLYKSR